MTQHHAFAKSWGAEPGPPGFTRFRLWGPSVEAVTLEIEGQPPTTMDREADDWFAAVAPVGAGAHYRYRLPSGLLVPDPASRLQAGDVHDASVVVDPRAYRWRHGDWRGRPWHEAVIYELHVGAFGGFAGVQRRLHELKETGFAAIELMPIADFPGQHNWGYDGVLPYAPDAAYGTPDDLKALIDAAHGLGLMIFLDVVYNHFGPDGNYLHAYAAAFFDESKHTPWGAAIDFRRQPVRDFFIENALYWLIEYRFDGLRFDAVHAIPQPEFLDAMAARIRQGVEPGRHVHLVLEHGGNKASHLRAGFDAQWADDTHHCLHVMLTGETEGYYGDFQEPAPLLARCLAEGFGYQGEVSRYSGKPRGEPSADLPTTAFVIALQNHDQIGNRAFGERLTRLADPEALGAATALLLLAPFVPLVFMGEEWGSERPFLYFTDHNPELAELVRNGRRDEFKHFAAFADEQRRAQIPDPNDAATFRASMPDFDVATAPPHAQRLALYRELLRVRHQDVVPRIPGCRSAGAQAIGEAAVRAAWIMGDGTRLIVATNLGAAAVQTEAAAGGLLFQSSYGAADALRLGQLRARTTVALLGPAR
ncbi:MAG: malto-oligosyltrehalose trehalohydrolase [Alphaproteobacteria bacterium]|nr:malto-oligosyltrehalose trehalohydrolase [Alphaproteobacteria bacterium]